MDFFGVCATFATRRIFDHDANIKLPTSHYSAGTSSPRDRLRLPVRSSALERDWTPP
jgi:hypothetical protein